MAASSAAFTFFSAPSIPPVPQRALALRCLASASSSPAAAWRPSKQDVTRLSRGQPASKRGTGSRAVPHRLNADEQAAFQRAKTHGFLTVRGSGARRERKGSPMVNTWRMWCDAERKATTVLHLGSGSHEGDVVVLDLATMRKDGWEDNQPDAVVGQVRSLVQDQLGQDDETGDDGLDRASSEEVDWGKDPTWRLPDLDIYWNCKDRATAKSLAKVVANCDVIQCPA